MYISEEIQSAHFVFQITDNNHFPKLRQGDLVVARYCEAFPTDYNQEFFISISKDAPAGQMGIIQVWQFSLCEGNADHNTQSSFLIDGGGQYYRNEDATPAPEEKFLFTQDFHLYQIIDVVCPVNVKVQPVVIQGKS